MNVREDFFFEGKILNDFNPIFQPQSATAHISTIILTLEGFL